MELLLDGMTLVEYPSPTIMEWLWLESLSMLTGLPSKQYSTVEDIPMPYAMFKQAINAVLKKKKDMSLALSKLKGGFPFANA